MKFSSNKKKTDRINEAKENNYKFDRGNAAEKNIFA